MNTFLLGSFCGQLSGLSSHVRMCSLLNSARWRKTNVWHSASSKK